MQSKRYKSTRTAAIAELRAGLSGYLESVKAGEQVVVTDLVEGAAVPGLTPDRALHASSKAVRIEHEVLR